jgi:hypothetical protein
VPERGYIVSPAYDLFFFILSPLLALALGIGITWSPLQQTTWITGKDEPIYHVLIDVFIMAHLALVFVRSHLNPTVFRTWPLRFVLIPPLLYLALVSSTWIFVSCAVLATFWDVYHSSLQTFGFGRLYDRCAGNNSEPLRRLDQILNLYVYAGPILAGASLMLHVQDFERFEEVESAIFTRVPVWVEGIQGGLLWAVVLSGAVFAGIYLRAVRRQMRSGYHFPPQKAALLLSTAICTTWAWGFNPYGKAFFIANFFHALQYFALVWWTERESLTRVLRQPARPGRQRLILVVVLLATAVYGFWGDLYKGSGESPWIYSLFLTISLLHFWYDGFIWSVRRGQV